MTAILRRFLESHCFLLLECHGNAPHLNLGKWLEVFWCSRKLKIDHDIMMIHQDTLVEESG